MAAGEVAMKKLSFGTGAWQQLPLIGEGGFGKVYKGKINGQMVAVKQLARDGVQGSHEFLMEVLMLTVLNQLNLVSLVGFCAQGNERSAAWKVICLITILKLPVLLGLVSFMRAM